MNAIWHKKLNILNFDLTIAFLMAIIIFISCPGAFAVEPENNGNPANIEADSMDYDNVRDVYHAQGKVNIIYSGAALYADDMTLDNKNNIATAQGSASLKMGEDTLHGDKIVFNIENKTGAVYKAHAFYAKNHFYIKGDKIEKTGENTYFIEQPFATTCDGDNPDWAIAGSEMKVTIEGYGLMKNARLLAKGLPVFYSPFLPFPAKTQRQSGFLVPVSFLFQKIRMASMSRFLIFGRFLRRWTRRFISVTSKKEDLKKARNSDTI